MRKPTPEQARERLNTIDIIIGLLKDANAGNSHLFPSLSKKIRSAIKSAEGAKRNAERFTR